jgi:adenylate kinase family enzyme
MIILISGASHTGKTLLAQKMLEKYHFPLLSLDLLKMGLIRSKQTDLTALDDDKLTDYLWPIVREMIKTAIENKQNLIVEGCYIPFAWRRDFSEDYLAEIKYICLIMSRNYILYHFADIKKYADVIEQRLDDGDFTQDAALKDNEYIL